jgi:hypothetical protein
MYKKYLFLLIAFCFVAFQYPAQAQQPDTLPTLDELAPGWNVLLPGGETTCARGAPYRFLVRPADSDKVLIHFQGGGGCWDAETCSQSGAVFQDEVPEAFYEDGIFDLDAENNPVADYNTVVVGYCTGDIHIGDATVDYTDDLTIEHKGRTNTNAVLDWVYENFPAPSDVIVTGCSAGAYGSIYHAGAIMNQYENITVRQLGDSGVGVVAEDWDGLDTWAVYDGIYSEELRETAPDQSPRDFSDNMYIETARLFPENTFAQYTTANDEVQAIFYFLQGAMGWTGEMFNSQEVLNETIPNYYSFIAGGAAHCILPLPGFYTFAADGVNFSDWFTALVEDTLDQSITCEDCDTVSRQ